MFLVNVHELEVILAEPVALRALKCKAYDIRGIFSGDGQQIVALQRLEDLVERREVDSQSEVPVATPPVEQLRLQHHGDEGDVRVVHGLQRHTGLIAVEVAVLNEVLDRIDDLCLGQHKPTEL